MADTMTGSMTGGRTSLSPNSPIAIRKRIRTGLIWGVEPFFMALVRLPLGLIGQFVMYIFFASTGSLFPGQEAAAAWPFYMPVIVDSATFLLMVILMNREGIHLRDLFDLGGQPRGRDWWIGIGSALGLLILYTFGVIIGNTLIYGPSLNPLLAGGVPEELPPYWIIMSGLFLFPITSTLMESLLYFGYALPRMEQVTEREVLSILLVGLAFALQHIQPLVSWQQSITALIAFVPAGLFLAFIALKTRRILPVALSLFVLNLAVSIDVLILPIF